MLLIYYPYAFSHFPLNFHWIPNAELFINFKKSFSNSLLLLFLIVCSYQYKALTIIFVETWLFCVPLLILIHYSMLVLKLLCVWHIFLCRLYYKQVFLLFKFFFFQVKMVTLYGISIMFFGTLYLPQENILYHFFRRNFLWTLHWNLINNSYNHL